MLLTVHAKVLVLVPPDQYKQFTVDSTTAAVSSPNFNWADPASLPTTDFYAMAWIKSQPETPNDAIFLEFQGGSPDVALFARWASTQNAFAETSSLDAEIVSGNRPANTWFHLTLGSNNIEFYLVVTLRSVTKLQFTNSNTDSNSLSATARFSAPTSMSGNFFVRHM